MLARKCSSYVCEAQLKVALLHYFSRNFDDAYLELGTVLERESSSQVNEEVLEKGNLLLEKVTNHVCGGLVFDETARCRLCSKVTKLLDQ
eukprot:scaffold102269_cov18-Tisochrysis_lutea.AAC.1